MILTNLLDVSGHRNFVLDGIIKQNLSGAFTGAVSRSANLDSGLIFDFMTKNIAASLQRKQMAAISKAGEATYKLPMVRKMIRAQLAACVYSATQRNCVEQNCVEKRVEAALRIADEILLRA